MSIQYLCQKIVICSEFVNRKFHGSLNSPSSKALLLKDLCISLAAKGTLKKSIPGVTLSTKD